MKNIYIVYNSISCIVPNFFDFNKDQLTDILWYGKEDLDNINNTSILDATINYSQVPNNRRGWNKRESWTL